MSILKRKLYVFFSAEGKYMLCTLHFAVL